jgi:hypothetical protein
LLLVYLRNAGAGGAAVWSAAETMARFVDKKMRGEKVNN